MEYCAARHRDNHPMGANAHGFYFLLFLSFYVWCHSWYCRFLCRFVYLPPCTPFPSFLPFILFLPPLSLIIPRVQTLMRSIFSCFSLYIVALGCYLKFLPASRKLPPQNFFVKITPRKLPCENSPPKLHPPLGLFTLFIYKK